MTTTPIKSKLQCKTKADRKKDSESALGTSSNKNAVGDTDGDYSPLFFPQTQEQNEDIDVLWDWHSPQTSQKRRKKQKRLIHVQSPKVPIKSYFSNNSNQNFDKLRNELKALQEELALPDDESCLCVSPQQEQEFKVGGGNTLIVREPDHQSDYDLFNDSMDEQLVLFSQMMEKDIDKKKEPEHHIEEKKTRCKSTEMENLIDKYCDKKIKESNNTLFNDSFDLMLSNHEENTSQRSNKIFPRTMSDGNYNKMENVIHTVSGKLEFHRTKSFELSSVVSGQNNSKQCLLEEIERKRLEAKAKLDLKKKKEQGQSASQCLLEEIEKKRLQALAKLEARRLQDIEKKRQEALKKLQLSRMRSAGQVKDTLSKRL